jgi:putative tricarboxylic transport membrane protein
MLSAFESYGIQPGPMLFTQQGSLVWTLIASLFIGNLILLLLNLPLVGLWVRLLHVPPAWLYPGIVIISAVGVYGASNSLFDVALLFAFGLLGYGMRRFDFPVAPLLVGLILSPMLEQSVRQALTISQGQWTTFISRPISAGILLVSFTLLAAPMLMHIGRLWRRPSSASKDNEKS